MPKLQKVIQSLSSVVVSALSTRLFYSQSVTNPRQFSCPNELRHYLKYMQVIIASLKFGKDLPPTTPVPCRSISSLDADGWDVALCLISI
jgi:diphthine-ammonia ligase